MKSILITLLTIISFTTFSQNDVTRFDYVHPITDFVGWNGLPADINKAYIANTSVYRMKDPVVNLQLGAKDQLRANNYKWAAIGLNATAYGLWMIHISSLDGSTAADTGVTPFNVLGTIAGIAGVGCWTGSLIHERRAVKRMYWGINGITIPLNQQ